MHQSGGGLELVLLSTFPITSQNDTRDTQQYSYKVGSTCRTTSVTSGKEDCKLQMPDSRSRSNHTQYCNVCEAWREFPKTIWKVFGNNAVMQSHVSRTSQSFKPKVYVSREGQTLGRRTY